MMHGLKHAMPARRGWLGIFSFGSLETRQVTSTFRVSCSALQPSQRRSQRLRQPKPSLGREEALRRMQQREDGAEAQQAADSQAVEQEEGGVYIDEDGQLVAATALAATDASAAPAVQPPLLLAAPEVSLEGVEPGAAPSDLERLKGLLRKKPLKQQQQQLDSQQQQGQLAPASAAEAALPTQERSGLQSKELVEADEIREPGQPGPIREPSLEDLLSSEDLQATPDRRQEALLAILNSGGAVEERILQHRDIIDDHMLQLLIKRIELAAALEQEDAVRGLQLLYRRLKAEVDRKAATPAMRLLDDLINILDPGDDEDVANPEDSAGAGSEGGNDASAASMPAASSPVLGGAPAQLQEARQAQVLARLQAAFGLGLPQGADVMTLASQLAEGGEQLAEGLFDEVVDPEGFLAEVSALLDRASAQREQLATHLQRLQVAPPAMQQAQQAQRAELESALAQRDHALGLVREVLELVSAWRARQTRERLRQLL